MKKILLILAAMVCLSFTAKAQWYTGGTIGFGLSTGDPCKIVYGIEPEIGYRFTNKYSAGMSVFLGGTAYGTSIFKFRANPYFRWAFLDFGPLKFFADAILSMGTNTTSYKVTPETSNSYTTFGWGVSIAPGLLVDVTERCAFVAHFATIGVSGDAGNSVVPSTAAFDLAVVNGPSVGIHYYF